MQVAVDVNSEVLCLCTSFLMSVVVGTVVCGEGARSNFTKVIVNKLHCKKVVGRWSVSGHPTTYRPPTVHLPTTYQPPTDHLPTTYRPPTDHLTTDHLTTDHLPTTYRPHTDHLLTTYRPHTDHIPTTYRPLTDHSLATFFTVQLVHNCPLPTH